MKAYIMSKKSKTVTLGGGCFWCVEAQFNALDGVEKIEPGYMGGTLENPTYEQVCTGETGHAEVVNIHYNPEEISYELLIYLFFHAHDPTQLNRQGGDIGTQYRSVIFYEDQAEKESIERVINNLKENDAEFQNIVTSLEPKSTFYKAEAHHFNYFEQNPNQSYCKLVIAPKLASFKQKIKESL